MLPRKRWRKPLVSSKGSTNEPNSSQPVTFHELYAVALEALHRRDYPTAALKEILLNCSSDEALVTSVLQRLTRLGYLNDLRYIQWAVQSGRDEKLRSRSRIESDLRTQGLDPHLIEQVLKEAYPPAEAFEQMTRALQRKLKSLPPPMDAKKIARLYNYLLRQGFQEEAVRQEIVRRFKHLDFDS